MKSCYCCDSKKISVSHPSEGSIFETFCCQDCGFEHFAVGMEDLVSDSSLYEMDSDYNDDILQGFDHRNLMLWHHRQALEFIQHRYAFRNIHVLDVGCHMGFFVKELCNKGFDAYGIDFNAEAVRFGQKVYGLGDRISEQSVDSLRKINRHFDVICLFEVLEHVENPRSLLGQVGELMAPHGLLILSVPNKNMLWRPPADFPPHHLSRFSPDALGALVKSAGFRILVHREQMSLFQLVRNYIGAHLRSDSGTSLRGGTFRHPRMSLNVRNALNHVRPLVTGILMPLDLVLHFFGVRYIGQFLVAKKESGY